MPEKDFYHKLKQPQRIMFQNQPIEMWYDLEEKDHNTVIHLILIVTYKNRQVRWIYEITKTENESMGCAVENKIKQLGSPLDCFTRNAVVYKDMNMALIGALLCDKVEPMVEELAAELCKPRF